MPRYIIKIKDRYLDWSTIVDAPVTWGMTLEEFKEYYIQEYGAPSLHNLHERLQRVEEKGYSSPYHHCDLTEFIAYNRAGYKESQLTLDEIYDWYCVKKQDPNV